MCRFQPSALIVTLVAELWGFVVGGDLARRHNSLNDIYYTAGSYPDVRGKNYQECGSHIQSKTSLICDPDRILTAAEANSLNAQLYKLATETSSNCPCRPAQCFSNDVDKNEFRIGFVLAIAVVRNLHTASKDPSQEEIELASQSFARSVHGAWALGDCGNAALIVFWQNVNKLFLFLTDSKTFRLYVTQKEADMATSKVQPLLLAGAYKEALQSVIEAVRVELDGPKEEKTDTGFLALIIAISVAVLLVCIITGCVCAFRCCGNLRPQPDSALGRTWERVGSISAEVIRRGTIIRRSFSRSPKTSHAPRNPQYRQDTGSGRIIGNEEGLSMV